MPYRCKSGFAFWVKGSPTVVRAGDIVSSEKDPRYKGHEENFESIDEHMAKRGRPVEQATAAPGEVRTVVHPAPPVVVRPAPRPGPPPPKRK